LSIVFISLQLVMHTFEFYCQASKRGGGLRRLRVRPARSAPPRPTNTTSCTYFYTYAAPARSPMPPLPRPPATTSHRDVVWPANVFDGDCQSSMLSVVLRTAQVLFHTPAVL